MNQLEKIMVFKIGLTLKTHIMHDLWNEYLCYITSIAYIIIIISCYLCSSLNLARYYSAGFTLVRHIYLSVASILCSWLCMVFFNVKNGIQHLVECTICNNVIHISA